MLLLVLLSLPLFFVRPTALGLFTTQEAIRVNVALEMQRAGSWIVPLRHGEAYIAKPPMVYWCQMGLARLRGAEVSELDARVNAAIWGLLGVVSTYFAARRLLGGDRAALWSALALECGVLYVHQSRVGEIDIMLVAPVVAAVGGVHALWSRYLRQGRAHWPALLMAGGAATLAVMIKGPPALMVIGLAGSGAAVIRSLMVPAPAEFPAPAGSPASRRLPGPLAALLRPGSWFRQLECTHPLLVLGVPALVFWWWLRAVAARVGESEIARKLAFEADDNLRLFEPGAWARNAEAVSYALGAFSLAGLIGLAMLFRNRRAVSPGQFLVLAWAVLGFLAFSLTTKGVSRYLTPVWPALAMGAGYALDAWLSRAARPRRASIIASGVVVLHVVALSGWYGFLRADAWLSRSPRHFMAELLPKIDADAGGVPGALGSLMFNFDALDYYAGREVEAWGDGKRLARPVAELVERIRSDPRPYTLLVLEENPKNRAEFGSAAEILKRAGLAWDPVPVAAVYKRPPGDARVLAWRIRPDAGVGIPPIR